MGPRGLGRVPPSSAVSATVAASTASIHIRASSNWPTFNAIQAWAALSCRSRDTVWYGSKSSQPDTVDKPPPLNSLTRSAGIRSALRAISLAATPALARFNLPRRVMTVHPASVEVISADDERRANAADDVPDRHSRPRDRAALGPHSKGCAWRPASLTACSLVKFATNHSRTGCSIGSVIEASSSSA